VPADPRAWGPEVPEPLALGPWTGKLRPAELELVHRQIAELEMAVLEAVEPPVEPWRPAGPLPLAEAVERLVLLEHFCARLDAEAVGLRVRVLTAYRDREAAGIQELAACTRTRGEETAARSTGWDSPDTGDDSAETPPF